MIFPLRWKKGEIIDCAFASVLETGTQKQFYINIHVKEGNRYRVENKIIVANNLSSLILEMQSYACRS